jgi:hypothetical protein
MTLNQTHIEDIITPNIFLVCVFFLNIEDGIILRDNYIITNQRNGLVS